MRFTRAKFQNLATTNSWEIGEDNVIVARGEDGEGLRDAQHLQASRRAGLRGQVGQPEDLCLPLPRLGL